MKSQKPIKCPKPKRKKWVHQDLPDKWGWWPLDNQSLACGKPDKPRGCKKYLLSEQRKYSWEWPSRPLWMVSDLHADSEAFIDSLAATGGVKKTGKGYTDFKLTRYGKKGKFIIGGDCMDKGPSAIKLLQSLQLLKKKGAKIKQLAGNHDVRLMMGLRTIGLERDVHTEHFFIRMGPKVVPFLKEVYNTYLDKRALKGLPDKQSCYQALFPSPGWYEDFPNAAAGTLSKATIELELRRMQQKQDGFLDLCDDAGLSLPMVYAATLKSHQLFYHKKGEFHWFLKQMRLMYRQGSFLFVHAGVDDDLAQMLFDYDIAYINEKFRQQMYGDMFSFYYGVLANAIRTKYRETDRYLSAEGAANIHAQGIRMIVHGHRRRKQGQRLVFRQGLLHLECDVTLDRHSRQRDGLSGYGAGVTIIHPHGHVMGISSDYPYAKVFTPYQSN